MLVAPNLLIHLVQRFFQFRNLQRLQEIIDDPQLNRFPGILKFRIC